MEIDQTGMTVGSAIASMLPQGTYPWLDEEGVDGFSKAPSKKPVNHWDEAPVWPTDVFAVAAHLIHSSGLLTYFDPDPDFKRKSRYSPLAFTLDQKSREKAQKAGVTWSESPFAPRFVSSQWKTIVAAWNDRLRASHHAAVPTAAPKWWKAALSLLIAADEACVGLGAPPAPEHPNRWLIEYFQEVYEEPFRADNKLRHNMYRADRQPSTFGVMAVSDIGCVQPKNRVSGVGCNLRNLTRNVAYLTHAGSVRCHWQQPTYATIDDDAATLDVLIIPVPYRLENRWVSANPSIQPDPMKRPNWGSFSIEQGWLDQNEICELVRHQVQAAKRALGENNLNGIVFPEYALTEELFSRVCSIAREIEPRLEFAITGSSSNCEGEHGNFVLTALWYDAGSGEQGENDFLLTSRRKHHRWRLEKNQITSYQLQPVLADTASWWEEHQIAQREVHFFQFRKSSVFTTMICEDLARSDPCHDILRAVGPNLLFALLMDGPQLRARWPYIYASSLADDPGTSVLSVTSMAMINRQPSSIRKPVVALWKDDSGTVKEISLDEGGKSVLLTLEALSVRDQTLDGRIIHDARSWRYKDSSTIF